MTPIPFIVVRSGRKTVAIHITREGQVELRCPRGFPEQEARRIIESKKAWIEEKLSRCHATQKEPPVTEKELFAAKKTVLTIVKNRADHYALQIGVTYGKISVRCQRTLWGSCSPVGDLSFNCLLSFVPPEILDYVVVHELCHRKFMDHSAAFWREVEKILPDYKERRRWLKENGGALLARLPKR